MTSDVAKKEELAQARATASQIRQGIHTYLNTLALIAKAYQQRHWKVLGYDSWQAYVDEEFGEERLKLPAEHRRKAVEELRLAGLSTPAIASAVGISRNTVAKDLAQSEQPAEITGIDGKQHPTSRPSQPSATAEAAGQLERPVVRGDREREAPTGSEEPVGAAETAVEGPFPSTEADGEGSSFGPVVPAAAPAPAVEDPAGAGVNPSDPDWKTIFLADVFALRRLTRHDVDVVADQADSECIEALGRAFSVLDEYRGKVLDALKASLPVGGAS